MERVALVLLGVHFAAARANEGFGRSTMLTDQMFFPAFFPVFHFHMLFFFPPFIRYSSHCFKMVNMVFPLSRCGTRHQLPSHA